jgi:hypothetical protein
MADTTYLVGPEDVEEQIPDTPAEVKRFRLIINSIKRRILAQLEDVPPDTLRNVQNPKLLDNVNRQIAELGNTIEALLNSNPDVNEKPYKTIVSIFATNGFDFNELDDEIRKRCLDAIDTDIRMYAHDLNINHIESI